MLELVSQHVGRVLTLIRRLRSRNGGRSSKRPASRPKEAESGGLNDAGVLGIRVEHATGVELVAPADSGLLFFVIPDSR
jgi:hypothetical protein